MDMVTWWPLLAAGLGSGGLAAAWWWYRSRFADVVGTAPRARRSRSVKRASAADDNLDTVAGWEPVTTRVLTSAEREAYHILRKALPDHVVLAQVPVARFIKVPTRNSYSEWLRRVGSLCADLVVCDMASQVIAVVEIRQPMSREKERSQSRHARMDRVLSGARIPVHVWLEGSLPGPAVAREAILGAAIAGSGRSGYQDVTVARRDAEAASVVASMQAQSGAVQGLDVAESVTDLTVDQWGDDDEDAARKEPPPSTWFDDLDSEPMPLEAAGRR
jgi:hypothetical protein